MRHPSTHTAPESCTPGSQSQPMQGALCCQERRGFEGVTLQALSFPQRPQGFSRPASCRHRHSAAQASTVPKVLSPMTTPRSSLSNCIYLCGCQHLSRPRSASMALCAQLCNHCSTESMKRPCGAGLGEGVTALWQQCPHVHTESRRQSPCRLETREPN